MKGTVSGGLKGRKQSKKRIRMKIGFNRSVVSATLPVTKTWSAAVKKLKKPFPKKKVGFTVMEIGEMWGCSEWTARRRLRILKAAGDLNVHLRSRELEMINGVVRLETTYSLKEKK